MNHSVPYFSPPFLYTLSLSTARNQLPYKPVPRTNSRACELLPDAAMTICSEDTCVRNNWKFKREQTWAHRGTDSIIVINKFDAIIVYFEMSIECW